MKTIISLGAGVQSSTMALMAAKGLITPMPDAAIFADTGAEPVEVMVWLDWLEKQLPFPVYRVMKKEGLKAALARNVTTGKRVATAPFYTESEGGGGMLRRQCTAEYKIDPITKKLRGLVGLGKGQRAGKGVRVTQWIGISWDEMQRMKESNMKWIKHRWPLIESQMTRGHCLEWMQANGYSKPPRSACTFCPYRGNDEWAEMKANDPISWQQAVGVDEMIRGGVRGTTEQLYVHRSMTPLALADLTSKHEGQQQLFSMMDECDGMCGV